MRDYEDIRVGFGLCEHIEETSFRPSGYNIDMPEGSRYYGYYFFVSDYWCGEESVIWTKPPTKYISLSDRTSIKRRWDAERAARLSGECHERDEYRYELIKKYREAGKRYSRPKLTYAELKAEFAEHSKQFYAAEELGDGLPWGLAYILEYANNGRITAGDVVNEGLCVGRYDDTWFYPTDWTRRKLGTKGARLLQKLEPDEVESVKAQISRYYELQNAIGIGSELAEKAKTSRGSDRWFCAADGMAQYLYRVEQHMPPHVSKAVSAKADEIKAIIDDYVADIRKEYDELDKHFVALIEGKPTPREQYERALAERASAPAQEQQKKTRSAHRGAAKTK